MTNDTLEKQTNRVADAIVELVERIDGPVKLTRVDREVAGFATHESRSWAYVIERGDRETVYWAGMTEAGSAALQKVLRGRRVAIQPVSLLPYLLEDGLIYEENWQPIVLLPARAANLDSPKWLVRASQDYVAMALQTPGWRLLKPAPVSFTADQFSL
jgi:hypothetical protein